MRKIDEEISENYKFHIEHLPEIKKSIDFLAKEINSFIDVIDKSPGFTALVQRLQVNHFLCVIHEMNSAIYNSIITGKYTAAESLSRVSLEMSANLLYILGGDKHGRSKGYLKYHLDHKKKNFHKWDNFSNENNNEYISQKIKEKIKQFQDIEDVFYGLTDAPFEEWPKSIFEKFEKIGHKEAYRTLYSTASDAVHLLGDDVLNVVLCNFIPQDEQKGVIKNILNEKISSVIYFLTYCLVFQFEGVCKVMVRMSFDKNRINKIEEAKKVLNEILLIHEVDEIYAHEALMKNKTL
ncbi:DUF5677 domain-containing protein [Comamonas sp. lk]|uniref:DUF5677 domain-containing protein n=1 Tax=Comamonas sp. lk TaxID=2201272 RepID=UPI0013CF0177|nr:DUF5677 domain-containing protein [Comamonas sp. lk]